MRKIKCLALAALVAGWGTFAQAAAVGKAAPDFQAVDTQGKAVSLKALKGHYVVLEWHNQDCPFVKSQYQGKMQELQKKWTKKTVLWFSVISSAPGQEGYMTAKAANEDVRRHRSMVSATFLDPQGELGKLYGAKTTPHMFVIDPKGVLVYDGAIDNAPLEDQAVKTGKDGGPFINYVDQALDEAMGGKAVSIPTTPPYGCHVKYAD